MADATDAWDAAWREFWQRSKRDGFEQAMAWLTSPACAAPASMKPGLVLRIGRRNLERIRVDRRDLTSNRRRPGAWE